MVEARTNTTTARRLRVDADRRRTVGGDLVGTGERAGRAGARGVDGAARLDPSGTEARPRCPERPGERLLLGEGQDVLGLGSRDEQRRAASRRTRRTVRAVKPLGMSADQLGGLRLDGGVGGARTRSITAAGMSDRRRGQLRVLSTAEEGRAGATDAAMASDERADDRRWPTPAGRTARAQPAVSGRHRAAERRAGVPNGAGTDRQGRTPGLGGRSCRALRVRRTRSPRTSHPLSSVTDKRSAERWPALSR